MQHVLKLCSPPLFKPNVGPLFAVGLRVLNALQDISPVEYSQEQQVEMNMQCRTLRELSVQLRSVAIKKPFDQQAAAQQGRWMEAEDLIAHIEGLKHEAIEAFQVSEVAEKTQQTHKHITGQKMAHMEIIKKNCLCTFLFGCILCYSAWPGSQAPLQLFHAGTAQYSRLRACHWQPAVGWEDPAFPTAGVHPHSQGPPRCPGRHAEVDYCDHPAGVLWAHHPPQGRRLLLLVPPRSHPSQVPRGPLHC